MPIKTTSLASDLDNCLINFDRKVVVTNLLDEYGGLLEETAKTVQKFLAEEEKKGKQFEKIFLLRGLEQDSENEVITLVPDAKVSQRKEKLRNAKTMLYSAERVGGTKSPPTEFVPLREMTIKLDSLVVKEVPLMHGRGLLPAKNGKPSASEPEAVSKKAGNALGAMFKKQESSTASKQPPKATTPQKSEPEKKIEKSETTKKQETSTATTKKSPKTDKEKKPSNSLGAMFKKQEAAAASKKSPPDTKAKTEQKPSKGGLSSFLTKKQQNNEPQKSKSPVSKATGPPKIKEEPSDAVNISVNLFEENESSSDDEEALDALKREVLTDEEDNEPSTSKKRRRIIDSDDEDTGPEVKIERKEVVAQQADENITTESQEPTKSETYMDDDGFIVTKKAKNQSTAPKKPNPTPVKIKTPTKVKKESPKSPTPNKKKPGSAAPKTKQGNIMNFFTKK